MDFVKAPEGVKMNFARFQNLNSVLIWLGQSREVPQQRKNNVAFTMREC
jgi:hypothetical protein